MSLYFEIPEKAIPEIRKLIQESDWRTLSRYYDLKDSDISREELLSGEFFIRKEKPVLAHPAGFWKYKHPFPPAYNFHCGALVEENIYRIEMSVEIDQGGGNNQIGLLNFFMIKSENGFQILPDLQYE